MLSTVHRGIAFEERCLRLLQEHLSMTIQRVGGKADGGIDLQGWWWLPRLSPNAQDPTSSSIPGNSAPSSDATTPTREPWLRRHEPLQTSGEPQRRIRVLGQCKAERKKMGPNYVREMEGVLYRHMASPTSSVDDHGFKYRDPIVALLLSESAFTKSTLLRALSSPVPFLLLHVPPLRTGHSIRDQNETGVIAEQDPGDIGGAVWNQALGGQKGLLKGEMEIRWERAVDGGGRPGLWHDGRKVHNLTCQAMQ